MPLLSNAQNWIHGYEYWFNQNYHNKTQVTVAPTMELNVSTILNTNNLVFGINTLHFRTWDSNGKFSVVFSKPFYSTPQTIGGGQENLIGMEYWFNNDFNDKVFINATPNQLINLSELISATNLKAGAHIINMRFKENTGLFTTVVSRFFMVSPVQHDANNEMVAYRYWFNNDFNQAVVNSFNPSTPVVLLQDQKSVAHLPSDFYTFNFQFQDKLGNWSGVTTDTIFKNPLPVSNFDADSTQFCEGTSNAVQFFNHSVDANQFLWDFGDGNLSTLENPVHTYSGPGAYNVSLQVIDSVSGLDSTFVWPNLIEVFDVASSQVTIDGNDSICDGQTTELIAEANFDYLWNTGQTGQSIVTDSTGFYWATITNPNFSACVTNSDTVMVNVFAMPNPQLTALPSDSICDGEVVQISAESNYLYAWNTNETTQEITVNSAGTYWAELFRVC